MPDPQMKTSAARPSDAAGKNDSVVASSRTVIDRLSRRVSSSTPRVRTELASHYIETTPHSRKPRRSHRWNEDGFRAVVATMSAIKNTNVWTDAAEQRELGHVRSDREVTLARFVVISKRGET